MSDAAGGDAKGYITDIAYTIKYYARQSPGQVVTSAQAAGLVGPAIEEAFTYADFGCGRGMTLLVLASVYPQARFVGVDVNEEHIVEARERAAAAGLTNLTFLAKSFDRVSEADMPPLDLATAHGVYSWVSPEVRLQLRDCVARHLKPDGLALVSYNVLAGYAGLQPIQALLMQLAQSAPGSQTEKRRAALSILKRMHATEQDFFKRYPKAAGYVRDWDKHDEIYLFHEYFNDNWIPLSFAQVSSEMADVGLHFCGDAVYPNWISSSGKGSRATWMTDPRLLEDTASTAMAQAFRYDTYAACGEMSFGRAPAIADDTCFCLTLPAETNEIAKAAAKTWLPGKIVKQLLAGPRSFGELRAEPDFTKLNARALAVSLRGCMAQGLVTRYRQPASLGAPPASGEALQVTTALGRELLRDPKLARHTLPLPALHFGSAVMVPPLIAAVLAAALEPGEADLAERVAQRAYRMTGVDAQGKKRETLESVRERVAGSIDRYQRLWLPFLHRAGVVEAVADAS
ncbi:MAG: class I SAM-dependent methyltransferase [Rhodospirillales bacterium]